MVLFKRKTVTIPPPKYTPEHPDQEVWFIPETLEYFCTYDEYLARMDFYSKNKFICELSGASCLTYFDARRRELRETENILKRFPDPLKRPILAKVHMATITRLDQLVDELYAWLKDRFFVGELVTVRFQDQRIRAEVTKADNGIYQVDDGRRILEGDSSQLVRDRKVVSKLTLRAFVKHSASREQWVGAPWIVREDYVEKFDLPKEIPPEVLQIYKQRAEETALAQSAGLVNGSGQPLPGSAHSIMSHKSGNGKAAASYDDDDMDLDDMDVDEADVPRRSGPKYSSQQRLSRKRILKVLDAIPETHHFKNDDLFMLARNAADEPLLDFVTNRAKTHQWPEWHSDPRLSELQATGKVGHLLEVWLFSQFFSEFLNIQKSDLLTFDEFVDALSSHEVPEPIAHLHESILNLLVAEGKTELSIPLPPQANDKSQKRKKRSQHPSKRSKTEHDNDGSEDDDDEGEHGDGDDDGEEEADDEEEDDEDEDSGDEADEEYDSDEKNEEDEEDEEDEEEDTWAQKIGRRQYANGGWQLILSEVLSDLCYLREWHPDTRAVVDILLPADQTHTQTSTASAYADLQLVHRVHALMMITRILYGSSQLRDYLDSQYDQLTKLRKRPLTRELRQLNDDIRTVERVIALAKEHSAENTQNNSRAGSESAHNRDNKVESNDNEKDKSIENGGSPTKTQSDDKEEKPDEEMAQVDDESSNKKSDEKEASSVKEENQEEDGNTENKKPEDPSEDLETLEKTRQTLLEQYNTKKAEADDVARQMSRLDNQRMRLLGKDRFFNRYWWMDGNGPSASVEGTYVMGKLCVQGPSPEDLAHCLNSQSYADEFVEYRKHIVQETQRYKHQHKEQLKARREAKNEVGHRASSAVVAASKNSTPAPDYPVASEYSSQSTTTDVAKIEKRLKDLLEINRVMHGLTEDETAELRGLQAEAAKLGGLVNIPGLTSKESGNSSTQDSSMTVPSSSNIDQAKMDQFSRILPKAASNSKTLQKKEDTGNSPAKEDSSENILTEQQMRLKQAQDQIQMQAQITARIQAHFDAEVQAQSDARTQNFTIQPSLPNSQPQTQQVPLSLSTPQPSSDPQAQSTPSVPPDPQTRSQPPPQLQPQLQPQPQPMPQPPQSFPAVQPPPGTQAVYPPPQQPYVGQVYPQQEQLQWVVQNTAYGPMLYAVPMNHYQMLLQQYGGLQAPGIPPNPQPNADAYQAYIQQVAMQQSYMAQGYPYVPGYPQQPMYGQPHMGVPAQHPALPQMQMMAPPAQPQPQTQPIQPGVQVVQQPAPIPAPQPVSQVPPPVTASGDSTPVAAPPAAASAPPPAQTTQGQQESGAEHTLSPQKIVEEDRKEVSQAATGTSEHSKKSSYLAQVMNPTEQPANADNMEKSSKIKEESVETIDDPREDPKPEAKLETKSKNPDNTSTLENASQGDEDQNESKMDIEKSSKDELNSTDKDQDHKDELKKETEQPQDHKEEKDGEIDMNRAEGEETGTKHSSNKAGEMKSCHELNSEQTVTPLELLDIFENKNGLLSQNEWRFYETPEEIHQLLSYLLDCGNREAKLADAIRKSEKGIMQSMELRMQKLSIGVEKEDEPSQEDSAEEAAAIEESVDEDE